MAQITAGLFTAVAAFIIIAGFKWLSYSITSHVNRIERKIDYMELKHEALIMALHQYYHNGFYIHYKNELERLSKDYNFVNKPKR